MKNIIVKNNELKIPKEIIDYMEWKDKDNIKLEKRGSSLVLTEENNGYEEEKEIIYTK